MLIACDHIDYEGALHGGGRQLIELVRGLDRRRVDSTVCILRAPTGLGLELQREGLPLIFFGDHRFNPVTVVKFARLIRERRIEVLHLTDFGACTFGRIAGGLAGIPSIVQIIAEHSEHQARGFPKIAEFAYRALAAGTAKALAISSSTKRFAVRRMGFAAERVEVLHYPLPHHSFIPPEPEEADALRRRLGLDSGAPVLGAVTRFYPAKGIRYLLDAFAQVRREFPNARLVLVGQGPEEAALRERCATLGVEEAVVFAGFQREAQLYVALFDVALVPSLEEAFGLVALEASSLGVPVVASRVGGLPDIVQDGETGLLVNPADSAAIAGAVLRLLRDPALRRHMSESAPRLADRFSLERYVDRLTAIYHELAAGETA